MYQNMDCVCVRVRVRAYPPFPTTERIRLFQLPVTYSCFIPAEPCNNSCLLSYLSSVAGICYYGGIAPIINFVWLDNIVS